MYLTLSPPIPLRLYTLPYWSNPPFLIFDIRALWRSGLSKIKNGGLDQYGAEPFEQKHFGTAGTEGVNMHDTGGVNTRVPESQKLKITR